MELRTGTRLGPYEILGAVGAGGMGEVYRARDTRLDRDVAIKVLPAEFSATPECRRRLEREARAISALSHPHICTLYDVGQQDGVDYLVMEYLDGETLEQRLQRGPLKSSQVINLGAEIADALDKAHRKGFVHRDLKPGNIMLTKGGAKLLDFGLAKPISISPANLMTMQALGATATAAKPLTAEGALVGTFQYMAPEQLDGKEADARSDIFAFGAVLYEMATGQRAFGGKSQASVIAAILASEPLPMSQLEPMTPPALERLVRRCLAKDPDERWQSVADVRHELNWVAEAGVQTAAPVSVPGGTQHTVRLVIVVAAVTLFLAAVLAWIIRPSTPNAPIVADIAAPENTDFQMAGDNGGPMALSPDGQHLAFAAGGMLWVRDLNRPNARRLEGTAGARTPFWSPDSRRLGFFAESKLKIVDANGGVPVAICDALNPRGGTWGKNNVILFTPSVRTPIYEINAEGGIPKPVTQIEPRIHTQGQERQLHPSAHSEVATDWSRDGKYILFDLLSGSGANGIYSLPVNGEGEPWAVVQTNFVSHSGHFSPDGRWIAYSSTESGREEVYVTSFPGHGGKWQISSEGGTMPRWRGDGKQLYFVGSNGGLSAADVAVTADKFEVKSVRPLFKAAFANEGSYSNGSYDVSRDGAHFIVNRADKELSRPITVIVNWAAALKK